MSYGRNPYYIYSNGESMFLDGICVKEEVINAFLYKILLLNRRNELKNRLQEGKRAWLKEKKWIEENEDKIIRDLMGL